MHKRNFLFASAVSALKCWWCYSNAHHSLLCQMKKKEAVSTKFKTKRLSLWCSLFLFYSWMLWMLCAVLMRIIVYTVSTAECMSIHIYKIRYCVGFLMLRVYTSVRIEKIIVYIYIFSSRSFFLLCRPVFLYLSVNPSHSLLLLHIFRLLMDVFVCVCYE